jgi:hypothetical protein
MWVKSLFFTLFLVDSQLTLALNGGGVLSFSTGITMNGDSWSCCGLKVFT